MQFKSLCVIVAAVLPLLAGSFVQATPVALAERDNMRRESVPSLSFARSDMSSDEEESGDMVLACYECPS
ncbi:hypothetical protein HYDPIDRAFT_109814 [Hydnomerulius pinastri MD-312]|nr:hypothetical protein HYDPIDRAFT_109814 [Hydnomerulius pinastri MD-312]